MESIPTSVALSLVGEDVSEESQLDLLHHASGTLRIRMMNHASALVAIAWVEVVALANGTNGGGGNPHGVATLHRIALTSYAVAAILAFVELDHAPDVAAIVATVAGVELHVVHL